MMLNLIVLLLMSGPIVAQDNKNTADQQLDLQEFVITGKTNAEIKGGLKMKPSKPGTLSKAELDSINTDVKIPVPLLPAVPLPSSALKPYSVQGYVKGEFGIFVTPNINAGYSFSTGGYAVDIFGNVERSSGHIDNADFTKTGISLRASYDAPKKFVFFGGSRTESGFSYSNKSFQLFGADKQFVLKRTMNDVGAHVDVKGIIGDYSYAMGAEWQSLSIETDVSTFSDARIKGFADITMPLIGMPITTSLLVDLHSYGEDSDYNLLQAGASTIWTSGDITIRGGAGLQSAMNSQGIQFGAVSLLGDIDYRLSSEFTAYMQIRSGLNNTSLAQMLAINPYLMNNPVISFRRDDIDIAPMLQWHPSIDLSSSIKISYRSSSNIPVIVPNSLEVGKFAGFDIDYISGTLLDMRFETQWKAWVHSTIGGFASYTYSSQADQDIAIPMIAPLTIGLRYERMWTSSLQSVFSIEHIGSRTIDIKGQNEIPSYIMANARLNYTIQKDFEAYLRIDNILNASVYLWNRFRERGTFVALGARYLF
ncbi:MAG: TonB-dependent receptor [Ignavibacteria bacterium]|nr:TonB-dependent receptor [Ignavibacteria bacterium]